MTQNSSKIAQLVDRLDDSDATVQRSVMDELVALGSGAVPILAANVNLVNARIRRGLVQVLGELGDARAVLPLMRYVFDRRGKFEESDGRALAMKSIIALTHGPDDRIFGFATDMTRDSDAFVRAYTMDLFTALSDRRGLPYAQDAISDSEEIVQKRASHAVRRLSTLARNDDSTAAASADEIIQNILHSTGNQREFNIQELLARPDAFTLAVALIRADMSPGTAGLRTLQQIDDPRTRKVAAQALLSPLEASDAQKAIGLRIIASHLRGDATPDERLLIERGLYDADRLVQLAALDAAGSSGAKSLIQHALHILQTSDTLAALTVAESLARAPSPALLSLFAPIDAALTDCRARRLAAKNTAPKHLSNADDSQVRLEAFLLRTIANMMDGDVSPAIRARAQFQALTSLQNNPAGLNRQPIDITALEVLDRTTSNLSDSTWQLPEILLLLDVHARSESSRSRRRTRQILKRVIPDNCPQIVPYIKNWRLDPDISLQDDVIALLERAKSEESITILEELSREPQQQDVRNLASAVLRRWRNEAPYIDVSFESPGERNDE